MSPPGCAMRRPEEPVPFRSRVSLREPAPGGARRVRTDDLMLAKHALYRLSYGPRGRASKAESRRLGLTSRPFSRLGQSHTKCGGPRQTRTADLTLIRRVL